MTAASITSVLLHSSVKAEESQAADRLTTSWPNDREVITWQVAFKYSRMSKVYDHHTGGNTQFRPPGFPGCTVHSWRHFFYECKLGKLAGDCLGGGGGRGGRKHHKINWRGHKMIDRNWRNKKKHSCCSYSSFIQTFLQSLLFYFQMNGYVCPLQVSEYDSAIRQYQQLLKEDFHR